MVLTSAEILLAVNEVLLLEGAGTRSSSDL